MSEFDSNHECPNCESVQTFTFGGSGNEGTCHKCDKTYRFWNKNAVIEVVRLNKGGPELHV